MRDVFRDEDDTEGNEELDDENEAQEEKDSPVAKEESPDLVLSCHFPTQPRHSPHMLPHPRPLTLTGARAVLEQSFKL